MFARKPADGTDTPHVAPKPPTVWAYSVTFEQPETQAPVTVRGTVVAKAVHLAAAKAIKDAKRQRKGQRFDSLLVLLERAQGQA
jgi:hypothetical protein